MKTEVKRSIGISTAALIISAAVLSYSIHTINTRQSKKLSAPAAQTAIATQTENATAIAYWQSPVVLYTYVNATKTPTVDPKSPEFNAGGIFQVASIGLKRWRMAGSTYHIEVPDASHADAKGVGTCTQFDSAGRVIKSVGCLVDLSIGKNTDGLWTAEAVATNATKTAVYFDKKAVGVSNGKVVLTP